MKKLLLIIAVCCITTSVNAQKRILINTWNKSNIEQYNNLQKDVMMNRYMFNGWNTFCVPFDMTEQQIDEVFGSDCRVETMVGATGTSTAVNVYFDDVKSKGIEANKPYLIYYTGESKYLNIRLSDVTIKAEGMRELTFNTADGTAVTLKGADDHFDGLGSYGILAADNGSVNFVPVTPNLNGIYPTRCSLNVMGSNSAKVVAHHGEPSGIEALKEDILKINAKYNINGMKVKDGAKGIIIENGKKHVSK
ncbi:MAG: hypothetical protein Q4F34_01050 [Prevotellaceae bacterium]|nr:hypothetical protein [Prevotellaceae bacterium]